MTKRSRRTHSAAFKARVALVSLKEDATMAELAARFGVPPSRIQVWRKQLVESAEAVFERRRAPALKDSGPELKELHAKIGQLTMARDFPSEKLSPWLDRNERR